MKKNSKSLLKFFPFLLVIFAATGLLALSMPFYVEVGPVRVATKHYCTTGSDGNTFHREFKITRLQVTKSNKTSFFGTFTVYCKLNLWKNNRYTRRDNFRFNVNRLSIHTEKKYQWVTVNKTLRHTFKKPKNITSRKNKYRIECKIYTISGSGTCKKGYNKFTASTDGKYNMQRKSFTTKCR